MSYIISYDTYAQVGTSSDRDFLESMFQMGDWGILLALANNPHCPTHILDTLSVLPIEPVPICGCPAPVPAGAVGIQDKWLEIRDIAIRRLHAR